MTMQAAIWLPLRVYTLLQLSMLSGPIIVIMRTHLVLVLLPLRFCCLSSAIDGLIHFLSLHAPSFVIVQAHHSVCFVLSDASSSGSIISDLIFSFLLQFFLFLLLSALHCRPFPVPSTILTTRT